MLDTRPMTPSQLIGRPLLARPLGEIVDGIADGDASTRDAGVAAVATATSAARAVAWHVDDRVLLDGNTTIVFA